MTFDTRSGATVAATPYGCVHLTPDTPPATLRVPAVLDSLDRVAEFVLCLGDRAGLSGEARYRLRLAADELATNIVLHGYGAAPGHISLTGGVEPDRVWLRFEDSAPAFDPRQGMRPPDLSVPLAEREEGGLGVFLAFTAVDYFAYELVDGRNVSTLVISRDHHG